MSILYGEGFDIKKLYGILPILLITVVIYSNVHGITSDKKIQQYQVSIYEGLILSTFGDSITEQNKWQPIVVSELGFIKHNNCGKAGTRVSGTSDNAMWQDSRINEIPNESNVILFMGGTNDWVQNVPLGTLDSKDTNTFYGALNTIYDKLICRFPNAKIIFMSTTFAMYPNPKVFHDKTGLVNNLGLMNTDYGRAIINVASAKKLPFIDLTNSVWDKKNISAYVTDDGALIHPNTEGGKKMAEVIVARLRKIKSMK